MLPVITCSSTPLVGPRFASGRVRGSTDTARTASATRASADASQRRASTAISSGINAQTTTYGVKATNCTSGPRSQPPNRNTAHPSPGSISNHTSTVQATRLPGRVAGGALVMVMAATLSGHCHPHPAFAVDVTSSVRVEVLRRHQEPRGRPDVLALEISEREPGVDRAGRGHDAGARGQRRTGPGAAFDRVRQPSAGRVGGPSHRLPGADVFLGGHRLPQQAPGPG